MQFICEYVLHQQQLIMYRHTCICLLNSDVLSSSERTGFLPVKPVGSDDDVLLDVKISYDII